jgi:small subunit ribosomal protein S1
LPHKKTISNHIRSTMANQRDSTPHGGDDFAAMLADYDQWSVEPEIGQKVKGKILSIGSDVAFIDLGAKAEGIIQCLELLDEDGDLTVDVGETIEVLVAEVDASGNYILRRKAGRGEASLAELQMAWDQKLTVEGQVTEEVKGGVSVMVGGIRAFCPVSQLDKSYVQDAAEFVGQKLEFRIRSFQSSGRHPNIVLSRRLLLEEEAAQRAAVLRQRLAVGAVLEGTVSSITTYGAFIDLGGLEGLLHASEMSHRRGIDPKEMVREGQQVKVQVLKIEPAPRAGQTERISLSMRALERSPWDDAERRFPKDAVVTGRVMNLEAFGAFVELEPGLEGLVHISQLGGKGNERHARQVVQLGEEFKVRVLSVDLEKRRISLTRETGEQEKKERIEVEEYLRSKADSGQSSFGSLGDFFKKK